MKDEILDGFVLYYFAKNHLGLFLLINGLGLASRIQTDQSRPRRVVSSQNFTIFAGILKRGQTVFL